MSELESLNEETHICELEAVTSTHVTNPGVNVALEKHRKDTLDSTDLRKGSTIILENLV